MTRDHNLLFGVFAVQLGKVSAIQIMDVAAAWALDTQRDIPSRLVELKLLSETDRDLLDRFVKEAVAAHNGDPAKTLASFGGEEQVHQVYRGSIVLTKDGQVSISPTARTPEGDSPSRQLENVAAVKGVFETPGRYTNSIEHARGGMGRVLLVHDDYLGREIALKELLPHLGTTDATTRDAIGQTSAAGDHPSPVRFSAHIIARFLQEARITGQLEHPSIVPVYELGHRRDGSLYYTMKLVRGRSLAKAIKECKNLEERLRLLPHFVDLCQAIAYAHSREIIHRDIKPANVMVGEFGETVVLDWGLAKKRDREDVHERELEKTLHAMNLGDEVAAAQTAYGQVLGTPVYMAPEQAKGDLDAVDEQSDVYALGVVLYEILSGNVPFEGKSTREILSKVVSGAPIPLENYEADAPPELAAIAAKAMQAAKAQRYRDVRALADEVQRFQSGALVGAYQYGRMDHVTRFVQRYRSLVVTGAVALLLVVLVTSYYAVRITRAQHALLAETERAEVERSAAEVERARALAAEVQAREQQLLSYATKLRLADNVISDDPDAARALLMDTAPGVRGWEWSYLMRLTTDTVAPDSAAPVKLGGPEFALVIASQDGTRALAVSASQERFLYLDLQSGTALGTAELPQPIMNGEISQNGRFGVGQLADGSIQLWDLERLDEPMAMDPGFSAEVQQMNVNSEGTMVLLKTRFAVNTAPALYQGVKGDQWTWKVLADELDVGVPFDVADDWSKVAVAGMDNAVYAYSLEDGAQLFRHEQLIRNLKFSPQGNTLFLGPSWDGPRVAQLLHGNNGAVVKEITGFLEPPHTVAFSPSGDLLYLGSTVDGVLVYRTEQADLAERLEGLDPLRLQFGQDGAQLLIQQSDSVEAYAVGSTDRQGFRYPFKLTAKYVADRTRRIAGMLPAREMVFASSEEGLFLAPLRTEDQSDSRGFEPLSIAWEPNDGARANRSQNSRPGAFSPNGELYALAPLDGLLLVWEVGSRALKHTVEDAEIKQGPVTFITAQRVAHLTTDGLATQHIDGTSKRALLTGETPVTLAGASEGTRLALLLESGTLNMWESEQGDTPWTLNHPAAEQIALDRAGSTLAIGRVTENAVEVALYDWGQEEPTKVLSVPGSNVGPIAFSPDGSRVAAGYNVANVIVWNVDSGDIAFTIAPDGAAIQSLLFTEHNERLITFSTELGVWDGKAGTQVIRLPLPRGLQQSGVSRFGTVMAGRLDSRVSTFPGGGPALLHILPWWENAWQEPQYRDELLASVADQEVRESFVVLESGVVDEAMSSLESFVDDLAESGENRALTWVPQLGAHLQRSFTIRQKSILPEGAIITSFGLGDEGPETLDDATSFRDTIKGALAGIRSAGEGYITLGYIHPPYIRARCLIDFSGTTDGNAVGIYDSLNELMGDMQSNESAAIGNLRTLVGAEVAYHAAHGQYTADFADLTGANPPFLDGDWSVPRSGYNFILGGDANNFTANANAVVYGNTGGKGFFTDSSGVIRYEEGADANASSKIIGQ